MKSEFEFLHRRLLWAGIYSFFLLILLLFPQYSYAANAITVNDAHGVARVVDGNRPAALRDARQLAYRDALRKGVGELVFGVRETEEIIENDAIYSQIRDRIYSQADGIVRDFKSH